MLFGSWYMFNLTKTSCIEVADACRSAHRSRRRIAFIPIIVIEYVFLRFLFSKNQYFIIER
jgi:hypothetical protein